MTAPEYSNVTPEMAAHFLRVISENFSWAESDLQNMRIVAKRGNPFLIATYSEKEQTFNISGETNIVDKIIRLLES